MRKTDYEFKVKADDITENGNFCGYASVFNIIDQGNDVVLPGAFEKSLEDAKRKDRLIPMLWQHNRDEPIGKWTKMIEDSRGLYVEGKLHIDFDPIAARAYGHLKAGSVGGLSIGYGLCDDGFRMHPEHDGVFELTELDLRETSIVTTPMLIEARVTDIKSMNEIGAIPSVRQFEKWLRDAGGFTKERAAAIAASAGDVLGERDAGNAGLKSGGFELLKQLYSANEKSKEN